LDIHETTLTSWVKHGLVTGHAYNGHYCLYEIPDEGVPQKQSIAPASNSATTGRPSTGVKMLGFALHSGGIGEPHCITLSRSRKTTYR
jgi:hypothetical protein